MCEPFGGNKFLPSHPTTSQDGLLSYYRIGHACAGLRVTHVFRLARTSYMTATGPDLVGARTET